MMRKILLTVIIAMIGVLCTEAKNHTVARGETLESIAKVYNIPLGDLIAANPGADQLFYVGLKLTIPENTTAQASTPQRSETNKVSAADNKSVVESIPQTSTTTVHISDNEEEGPGWSFASELGVGFLPKPKNEGLKYNLNFTTLINLYGVYWITVKEKGLFASLGIGYLGAYQSYKVEKDTYSFDWQYINLPVKIGYAFANQSKKFALIPYLGVDMCVTIAGKQEFPDKKTNVKAGKFAPALKIGAVIRIYSFDIGGYYAVPLRKSGTISNDEGGYFGVSIMFGL